MDRSTQRNWSTGLNWANFATNLLANVYQILHQRSQQNAAKSAFEGWQSENMLPSTATVDPGGGVDIESPGGKSMTIPTFKTEDPRLGPVDAGALASLYGSLAGVDPSVSSPYLQMGRELYGANAASERYEQERADMLDDRQFDRRLQLEDRDWNRQTTMDDRGFATRMQIAEQLVGANGAYDVADPDAYRTYITTGEGDLMGALAPRPEPINPLGVIQGKGGAFIPYQQGNTISGASVRSDIPLRDPTVRHSGGGGGMSPTQKTSLSVYYAQRDGLSQQIEALESQKQEIQQRMQAAAQIPGEDLLTGESKADQAIAELQQEQQKLIEQERKLRTDLAMLDARIKSWETGQVIRRPGGTQPAGSPPQTQQPQNPW